MKIKTKDMTKADYDELFEWFKYTQSSTIMERIQFIADIKYDMNLTFIGDYDKLNAFVELKRCINSIWANFVIKNFNKFNILNTELENAFSFIKLTDPNLESFDENSKADSFTIGENSPITYGEDETINTPSGKSKQKVSNNRGYTRKRTDVNNTVDLFETTNKYAIEKFLTEMIELAFEEYHTLY